MIHLEPITASNWEDAIELKVRPDQEHFVASNVYSIAESQFLHEEDGGTIWKYTALGIYAADEMIGFTMYCWEQNLGKQCFISRLMLSAHQQGKGYGKMAMDLLLTRIEAEAGPNAIEVLISYEPHNEVARKLYASVGFVETGEMVDGEVIAKRPLKLAS